MRILTNAFENANVWFHNKNKIVNSSKFQSFIVNRFWKFEITYNL